MTRTRRSSISRRPAIETLKVDLSVADAAFAGAIDAGVLFKETAAKCGIDINVIREPKTAIGTMSGSRSPCAPPIGAAGPRCDWMFTIAYAAGAAWNDTFWNNPRFNELLVAGPRRDRRSQARRDVCRDAAARA